MKSNTKSISRLTKGFFSVIFILFANTSTAICQQMSTMDMDTSGKTEQNPGVMQTQMMLPMAFFTHMGVPLNPGTYGLRMAALQTQFEGQTKTEFNFQFETGLSKTVGLFLGGEGLFADPTLEAMVQFLVLKTQKPPLLNCHRCLKSTLFCDVVLGFF